MSVVEGDFLVLEQMPTATQKIYFIFSALLKDDPVNSEKFLCYFVKAIPKYELFKIDLKFPSLSFM